MKNIVKFLSGASLLICFIGAITDSFSFKKSFIDAGIDHSIPSTLWVLGAMLSFFIFLAVYLSGRHLRKQKNN